MATPRSQRWSTVLLVPGALGLFLTGLLGWINAAVVNGDTFARLANEVRQDEAVKAQVGEAIAVAALDAQPDLVAVEPAISAGAAAVVGSPLLDGVFTPAIRSFHNAMTEQGSDAAVLQLADLGVAVTTALEQFVPQAAEVLPDDLNVTLAQVGGQSGAASHIIPVVQVIATAAWMVPIVAVLLVGLGVWVAPGRRLALVRLGWLLVVAAGFLGLVVVALNLVSAAIDDTTLSGAVLAAGLRVFTEPLAIRFVAIAVVGGLLVAAAGAFLPQVDVNRHARAALAVATRRPHATGWALTRALLLIAVGLLIVLFPTLTAQLLAVVAGLAVLFYGVTELDVIAERARARDTARQAADTTQDLSATQPRPSRAAWLIPISAIAVGTLVLAALIVPGNLPQGSTALASATEAEECNGHVELCDRPFDQVVLAASHNSMSVADGSWFLAEQPIDMVASLDDGIRGLLVDTWYGQPGEDGRVLTAEENLAAAQAQLTENYGPEVVASIRRTVERVRRTEPDGPTEPYFCHTVCEIGAQRMQPVMDRLNEWLTDHPREVVVLFIQDTVTPQDTDTVLRRAGLTDRAYVHPDGAAWPTLREMIEADTRLLVLMENSGGGQALPYLHQGFDIVQDTDFTFDSADDFTCTLNRGAEDDPLLMVNHWLAGFTSLVSDAVEVNAYEVLRSRVDECRAERGRLPSMVAVNWYDRGDLFRLVDELNGVS